ncbi:RimK/LysX family protein [Candidatus Woesearchaeota archaeon]|jgi:hypothetical protein|nr:RimK/LysX family protein [Candidatus Woesearchaeota archaeon]
MIMYRDKIIIHIEEKVTIFGRNGFEKVLMAKIDTGATRSSIDTRLASELKLGPIVMTKLIKSAHGNSLRPIVDAKIEIAGKELDTQFTIADRKHMKYKVLIGVNTLKEDRFLINPMKE